MRKTLAILAAVAFTLSACSGGDEPTPAAPTSPAYVESVPPSASVPTTPVDFRQDVGPVTAKARPESLNPEGDQADLTFTITNNGNTPATYEIVFAVFDSTQAQVGSILVNTEASNYGPTKPGQTLKVSGAWGMDGGGRLPKSFTVAVQSVDRITGI